MKTNDGTPMEGLLKRAVPMAPFDDARRDLWPRMQERLESADRCFVWMDWAVAAGLLVSVAAFPAAIPVLLYYL